MTDNTVYLSVKHIAMECNKCRRTFYLIEEIAHVCPYCYLDDKRKLVSHHTDEVSRLAKISADMHDEIEKLKRSNAALKGVITKMRNSKEITYQPDIVIKALNKSGKEIQQGELVSVEQVKPDPYEVDLCDLGNYTVHKSKGDHPCVYCDLGDRYHKFCDLLGPKYCGKIDSLSYLKFKRDIKADLESGKAVAKGGRR